MLCICLLGLAHSLLATTTIDETLDVGAIDGAHAVNLTGAFTYTIPIKIPEGTRGMQPNLSLNYNSQSGNGNAGYGWNLSGVSAISRVNRNIYNDGVVRPIELVGSDKYAIDGNRMITTKYGLVEEEFGTELESFSKIIGHKPANNNTTATNPIWFEVKTKDGKTIEYGNTNDSKLMTEDGSTALIWYISKVTDRNGNYMTYHYAMYGRQIVLDRIKYTGNDTPHPDNPNKPLLSAFTEIALTYKDRIDKSNAIIAGSKVESYKLLDKIEIETNSTHYKSYQLQHSFDHCNYLTGFQEWGNEIVSSGKGRLNSLTFTYDRKENYNTTNYKVTQSIINSSKNNYAGLTKLDYAMIPGNFNGDGLQDFLTLKYVKSNSKGKYLGVSLQLNNSTPEETKFTEMDLSQNKVYQNNTLMDYLDPEDKLRPWTENSTLPIADMRIITGDVNGDNIDDIIIYDAEVGNYKFFASKGIGQYEFASTDVLNVTENNTATLIDVDGDNLLELFVISRSNNENKLYLKSFDSRHDRSCWSFGEVILDPSQITGGPKDVDGDGRMEYEFVQNGTAIGSIRHRFSFQYNLMNTPNSQFCNMVQAGSDTQDFEDYTFEDFRNKPAHFKSLVSDFNGDGRADFFRLNQKDQKVEIRISNENIPHNIPFYPNPEYKIYTADLNGDGLTDVFYAKDGLTIDQLIFYINKGEGKSFNEFTYSTTGVISADKDFVQMADVNGDGIVEILFKRQYQNLKILNLSFGKPVDKLLTSIKDSHANETKVHYGRLSSKQSYTVSEDSEITYPLRVIDGPFYVTNKVEIPANVDGSFGEKTYAYENLIAHLEGKGLLGFLKVTETDKLNGVITESSFHLDKEQVLLYPKTTLKSLLNPTGNIDEISESISSYTVDVSSLDVKWLKIDQTETIDHVNKSKTITQFQNYDNDGNPEKTIATIYDTKNNPATLKHTTTTDITYENCEWWINYLPKTVTTELDRAGYSYTTTNGLKTSNKRKIAYEYDLTNGNLKKEIKDPTTYNITINTAIKNELSISYSMFDDFGNPTIINTVANDDSNTPARSSKVVYDNTGRFIVEKYSSSNSTTAITTTTINQTWGLPATVTDINGNVTSFTYDNYGRLNTSTDYLGHTETITLDWHIIEDVEDTSYDVASTYMVTSSKPGTATIYNYYDSFGREVFNKTAIFGDSDVFSLKRFDNRGRVKDTSGPFKDDVAAADQIYTWYEYDDLNRPTTEVTQKLNRNENNAIEKFKSVSYSYPTRMVQITGENIIPKTTTYDLMGKVITAQEISDTEYLHYSYNNFNELYQVKDQNGKSLVTNGYDVFGRQISLGDINAGTTRYKYNAFNELTDQTDAKNSTTIIEYDELGRITTKKITNANEADVNYDYTYNAINVIGALSLNNETGPDNSSTTYTYDSNGRQISYTDNINGKTLTTSQTFDEYGNIKSITYPGNVTVDYSYDDKGTFYKASIEDDTIYEMKELNQFGQTTKYDYSNSTIPVEHTYNLVGMPVTTQADKGNLFNWAYDFNTYNGNLNSRTDVLKDKTENFEYDALHRLTRVNGIDAVKYSFNGNIDWKKDAGDYTYNQNTKINAVSGITNEDINIPLLTEEISYTTFDRPKTITEGDKSYELFYGPGNHRIKTKYTENGSTITRYYSGSYEEVSTGTCGATQSIYYLSFANSVDVIYYKETPAPQGCRTDNITELTEEFYYVFTDYLGSILKVVDSAGNTKEEQSFDAWGRKRNPTNWQVYNNTEDALPKTLTWLNRGYTGHEHLYQFGIINMNNRLYDPIVGRMLAVDNFVADSGSTQAFNRYSYVMNNPLKYVDPSGEWAHLVFGAIAGGIQGYIVGKQAGLSGFGLFAMTIGGAAVGALSGGVGNAISTSGIAFSNTLAIAGASAANSIGMKLISAGQTDFSVSFGFGSFNFDTGEFGYLGKKGNSKLQNLGYGLGAFANLSDIYGFALGAYGKNTEEVDLITKNDAIGHTAIVDKNGNTIISVGPGKQVDASNKEFLTGSFPNGTNDWNNNYNNLNKFSVSKIKITNVRTDKLNSFVNSNLKDFNYGIFRWKGCSCVSGASRGLLNAGVLHIPYINHPSILQLQIAIRRYSFMSYTLEN